VVAVGAKAAAWFISDFGASGSSSAVASEPWRSRDAADDGVTAALGTTGETYSPVQKRYLRLTAAIVAG
jgi:hypothetical protein